MSIDYDDRYEPGDYPDEDQGSQRDAKIDEAKVAIVDFFERAPFRSELATRHVMESDRPLTEVATLLGFSAPSGFSRWYHAQFGCSPKESRAASGIARRQTAPSPTTTT